MMALGIPGIRKHSICTWRMEKQLFPDKVLHEDVSPKPTMFLPSVAETNIYKAGTYLCLLEKFFPEDIKVFWKEKDNDRILESQQGEAVKINDTYIKLSWLTVTGDSLAKEHKFIVKRENNKGRVDQKLVFPPIKKDKHSSHHDTHSENRKGDLGDLSTPERTALKCSAPVLKRPIDQE